MIEFLLHCGYDTLEYSWVKATIGIIRLQIILCLRNTNKLFWFHCRGSQLILSICWVNKIQLVNTISLLLYSVCGLNRDVVDWI
jgi:hypothetical protein